jgi:flagellin-specific chaperone FliS
MEERELTFGEKLVGITFNPSGDERINRAKELCAELADLLYQDYDNREEVTDFYDYLYEHAVGEILNAQMNAVKVLTFKY